MPNGQEFVSPTQELQDEFNRELEALNQRIATEFESLPARERLASSLPLQQLQAKQRLVSDYERIAGAEQLGVDIEAGAIPELAIGVANDLLFWKERESELIREERQVENGAYITQKFMADVGAPSILTKTVDFFYNLVGRPRGFGEGVAAAYELALNQYNGYIVRLGEISTEKANVITYQTLFEALPAFIHEGKITEYADLFTLKTADGTAITRFIEIGEDDEVLRDIFNKVYESVLGLPEGIKVEEFNYEEIIAQLAKEPTVPAHTVQEVTVDIMLRALTTTGPPLEIPAGLSSEDILGIYQEAGIPDELVEELEGITAYTNQMEELWTTISSNQTAVLQGLEEVRMPEMGLGDYLIQTIAQPALSALDMFGNLYHEWTAPWGGWLYRQKAQFMQSIGASTSQEREFLRVYQEAIITDDSWHAGGEAFRTVELGFANRLMFEWILDPVTWLGFGIMTNVASKVPVIGSKFLGPAVGAFERGWLKAWDKLIFDRIKAGGRFIAKTPLQASKMFAGADMIATARYLTRATSGRYYSKIPLDQAQKLLLQARDFALRLPGNQGSMATAGRALLRTSQIDELAVKKLATTFGSEIPITREMILNISSIVNGQVSGEGAKVLTKKEAAPFLLRALGVSETKATIRKATTEINRVLRLSVTASDNLIASAKNTPDLLAKVYNKSQNAYLDTVAQAAAHNLEMSGRMSHWASKIEWATMTTWRNTMDRWVVTPGARMYLAFSAYGPGNVLEGFIKQVTARQIPYNPLRLLRSGKPVSVVNPTARAQKMLAGLNYPIEILTGTPRIEMAGEVPSFLGIEKQSKNLKLWRSILSGGPIGRFFIDLPGRVGLHQRADYFRKMFLTIFGEEEATVVMKGLTTTIDDAVKGLGDDFLRAINLTKSELKEELLERAIAGPAATRNILDDIVADRIVLEKGVTREAAFADRMAGGKVSETVGKYTLVPEPFHDNLIQSASDGSLWARGGTAIDDTVDGIKAGMYDYFVHSPEFYKTRLKERVDDILGMEARNKEEFLGMIGELQDLQKFYGNSSDDVVRAMNELEGEMSKRLKFFEFNEWRANYTVGPGGVYEGLADYATTMRKSLDALDKKLAKDLGAQTFTDAEGASINNWLTSWIDEQKFLADWWATRRTTEAADILRIKALKGDEKAAAWTAFKAEQNKAHLERITTQANMRTGMFDQSNILSEALGVAGPPPPILDIVGRKLNKVDVATLFHGHSSQLPQSMFRVESMALKSRVDFITEVKVQANRMARKTNKAADQLGWTDDAIGEVYDTTLRDMYINPELASVMEANLMELKALQDELWSIYRTKGLPEGILDDFQKFVDDVANGLDGVKGYLGPKVTVKGPPLAKEDIPSIGFGERELDIVGDLKRRVTTLAENAIERPSGITIDTLLDSWLLLGRNRTLQKIGLAASADDAYLKGVRTVLKEQYPSGNIRIFRGSGESKGRPLDREFTNVTSSREVAQEFEGGWHIASEPGGAELGVRPEFDDILIKVDDVVAIGAVDESELIIPARILADRIRNPIKGPPIRVPVARELSPSFQAGKQRAADKASKEYFKDWADYTNENATTAFMRSIYPFWTYELHRLFWLPRAAIRTPGVFKGWGSYMDNTEDGYIHIPGTSLEFNILRGTIFMGGMTRLIKRDYPEYYDMFPEIAEFFDWYSRFGFYPAAYLNFLKLFGGTSASGVPQFGELLPAWVKTPLNAYIAAFPDSGPAKFLLDTVLPEPYRNYATIQVANGMAQREEKTFSGIDIWDKLQESETLTKEEQELWTRATQQLGWMGMVMEQSGTMRIRTDEQLAAWEASAKLIEEKTGYTEGDQLWIRRHGFRIGDYTQLDPLDQALLGEMDAMKYHSGVFTALMPTAWQEEDRVRREFFRAVRDFSEQTKLEQEDLDRQVREGELNMDQWGRERSNLRRRNADFFTSLSETDRYKNIALEMEDITREDGTIREGLISRAEKRDQLPPVQHPANELLNFYYSLKLERKLDPDTGTIIDDWDGYFLKIDAIINALEEVQRDDFIQIITKNMTDLEKLRWQVSKRYFRGYNRRQEAILVTQFTDVEQVQIKKWIFGTPAERDAAREILRDDGTKLISSYQSQVGITSRNLRKLSPELDAWLQFFEITDSTLTDAAAVLYLEYRRDNGIRP